MVHGLACTNCEENLRISLTSVERAMIFKLLVSAGSREAHNSRGIGDDADLGIPAT